MFEYVLLDRASASIFRDFVFPETKALFERFSTSLYAIGAIYLGRPVGLGLAEKARDEGVAHVKMVAVSKEFQRKGIGKGIVKSLEETLRSNEIKSMSVEFLAKENQSNNRRFLEKCGFISFSPSIHIRQGPLASLMKWEWMNLTFPEVYKIDSWKSLTSGERVSLESEVDVLFPEILSPFPEEELIDAEISLLLRYKGKVAGWMMLEHFDQDTVLFKTMYVYPRYQRIGKGIVFLAETSRRVLEDKKYANGIFFVEDSNRPMLNFAKRFLSEAPIESETLWRTQKMLV